LEKIPRKEQILKAAAKRFARHGLNKTTLDEIARDLRIGKATIYHYFNSKDELFYATIQYDCDLYINDIKAIFSNDSIKIQDRFLEYYYYKELVYDKYKLLFDLILNTFVNEALEMESHTLKKLLCNEQEVIENAISSLNNGKNGSTGEKTDAFLPAFITTSSWGILFGDKMNKVSNPEEPTNFREILKKMINQLVS
jgi:AcrR family transcriptional regulator